MYTSAFVKGDGLAAVELLCLRFIQRERNVLSVVSLVHNMVHNMVN